MRLLFAASLLWLIPALACGSFAPRPTPEPAPTLDTATQGEAVIQATPPPVEPTLTLVPTPVSTNTPETSVDDNGSSGSSADGLGVGVPAVISAPNGLNVRGQPSTSGTQITRLNTSTRVSIIAGPEEADGYTWWRVDDGEGSVGWAAERDDETEWISPVSLGIATEGSTGGADNGAGDGETASSGERVRVTVAELSIRAQPSTESALLTRVREGETFDVVDGPQQGEGYTWLRVRSNDGEVEGWAAEGGGGVTWLTPIE